MKRGWFLLLALSLGLNASLLYFQLRGGKDSGRFDGSRLPPPPHERPGGGPPGGPPSPPAHAMAR